MSSSSCARDHTSSRITSTGPRSLGPNLSCHSGIWLYAPSTMLLLICSHNFILMVSKFADCDIVSKKILSLK
uniref:Uncharacterized protein n=1 Tax=Arundo donax TaxID=35708 RepID=A0A0A9E5W1_ARUDO